jgi:intracellular protein transport protein USO1
MPVPDTNGEEWDRLEAANGIDALLELIMHGEYNGQNAARRLKDSVDLRATAVGVFEVCSLPFFFHVDPRLTRPKHFVRDDGVKEVFVAEMLPPENAGL